MHPLTFIGILDFNGHYKERDKDKVCCRGHLLPTVKTNVYLYTDIDIFKTRHQLFLLFEMKKEWKKKDSGKLWGFH